MSSNQRNAFHSAVILLAKRTLSRKELYSKLQAKKCYSEEEIDSAMQSMERMGALRDRDLAESIVRSYRERGYGSVRIRLALQKRGIPEDVAEQVLLERNDFDSNEETCDAVFGKRGETGKLSGVEQAFSVLVRQSVQLCREPDVRKRKEKAVRRLVGRGFLYEEAMTAVDRWMREGYEEPDENEENRTGAGGRI